MEKVTVAIANDWMAVTYSVLANSNSYYWHYLGASDSLKLAVITTIVTIVAIVVATITAVILNFNSGRNLFFILCAIIDYFCLN